MANWRTTTTIIVILLQIQVLSSVKIAAAGVEGQTLTFRCDYPQDYQINNKYFCLVKNQVCSKTLIQTDKHDQWVEKGRFSIYDNTSTTFFIIQVDKLTLEDRGTYWCGVGIPSVSAHIDVVQLNVLQVNKLPQLPPPSPIFPKDLKVDKLHLPIYLTAVMCVAAILCVCMFTLGLLLAVKQRRSSVPHRNREISDYETMMADTRTEPELHCSCSHPDCTELSTLPPPPPDLCSHLTSNQRESVVSFGPGDYADVEGYVCQYQHLDLQQLEEHVYHSLHGNDSDKKDVPPGLNEQIST
ncbi:uncharacterized protein LOC121509074 [Cheilinus undulatus]|uniref:uncharacterized protein LOC121509074 n=1 Tax=Cheilinus undulatus TaxID=241271 RepID=UPI001BD4219A|nr:uncharacterized protein LOC121509074 [Cheilinus undulatus]